MLSMKKKGFVVIVLLLVAAGVGWFVWKKFRPANLPRGIAFGNGRIEATEVDVAAKQQGRVEAVLANEGDKRSRLLLRRLPTQ